MNKPNTAIRRGIRLFFSGFASLIALYLLTIIVHEGSHYVAAVIMKMPMVSFTWFDPYYRAPLLASYVTKDTLAIQVVCYAGGLVTGVLLLAILVLKRGWFRQSLYRWFLGLCVAVFGFWQICLGILEGGFNDMYIAGATNQLSLSYCIGYGSAALGAILYLVFMPGLKELRAKEKRR